MELNFIEKGNGFPQDGDIIVDHEDCKAYRVLPSIPGTGQGRIETGNAMRGDGNSTALNVEEVDYEDFFESADWEI